MFTQEEIRQIEAHGLTVAQVEKQIENFRAGFPSLPIVRAAACGDGIRKFNEEEIANILAHYDAESSKIRCVKFVPASGAASRMFKDVFAFVDAEYNTPETDFEKTFFARIKDAAFYAELDATCQKLHGAGIDALMANGKYKEVAAAMLSKEGMNYGALPKGLLKFHNYAEGARTPLEEHLVEGALYARQEDGTVNVHFTVSPEHRALFEALVKEKAEVYAKQFNATFNVSFSEQKSSTDTVAANSDNTPFRNADGSLLFRPGGHGALIENLNEIDADVVFIKNIDNVVPDRLKEDTVENKKLLAGILVELQQQAFAYLEKLDSGCYNTNDLMEMLQFLQKKICLKNPETKTLEDTELAMYLRKKLNRPFRVCGMVRNVGEPGGGPFLAYNPDGTVSLQVLESSQIDMNDPEKKAMFENGTHFNPVDLVCAVRDYKGNKFNLVNYVDKATGFISYKSKSGKELKALELPGLWNGAMSDWSTIFVEVPLGTFNPVKTVNDLLREQHQ